MNIETKEKILPSGGMSETETIQGISGQSPPSAFHRIDRTAQAHIGDEEEEDEDEDDQGKLLSSGQNEEQRVMEESSAALAGICFA